MLRLFVFTLTFAYAIFIWAKLGTTGAIGSRIIEAASITAGRKEILTLVTGLFSLALWFGLHSSIEPGFLGFHKIFSEECKDYDWWGRRISNRRR